MADSMPWWRHSVIYQIYPRSWADANGDGIGDLPGITDRLDYLATLGVDAVWLSPFYTSPQRDAGYDVADYRDVDPLFGTLADFDALVARAHELSLRVIVDIVPNHSSSDHPWFVEALAAAPGSDARARYVFRDGRGPDGAQPPNNWQSNFGGPAWTRTTNPDGTPGQWYLHLFDSSQPDFDWTNPEVITEFDDIVRFWFDRGVDGFRIDVAHGLVKEPGLPDAPATYNIASDPTNSQPMWDREGVHDIYRRWRKIAEEYGSAEDDSERLLCAEAWVIPAEALARYVRSDELHQSFNFAYLMTPWQPAALRDTIKESLDAVAAVDAPATWVLSNHDVVRHASRLAFNSDQAERTEGIGPDDPQPDAELGLRRARAATALMVALPGSAYLYQGEELGLPEATQLPPEVRQDPTFARTSGEKIGRDGCRVPIPWQADAPAFGFSPSGESWLPQPAEYGPLAVDQQLNDPASTLSLYRRLLQLRRELKLGEATLQTIDADESSLRLLLSSPLGTFEILTVFSGDPIQVDHNQLLVRSDGESSPSIGPDTTVWLQM